ncbi:MAG: adenosylcobinamide-GDP ribazoletransferase [Coriobacteriia bacterium]|nr:adenosylcobinamide-GDP ribazoletransferase [Coriobacteriia bacterium]
MQVWEDVKGAVGLLTLLPSGRSHGPTRPAAWFPWVGWVFAVSGLAVASAASIFIESDRASLLVAVLIVCVWAFLSRLLHWDGLADTADALWGGHTPQRRLEIMRDPRSGAFGIIVIVLMALLQVTSIAIIFASRDWWALGAAPVIGRFSASLGLWSARPAREDGLGASLSTVPHASEIMIAALAVGATLVVPCPCRLMIFCGAMVVAFAAPRLLGRKVGGVTGDILGASVMIVETVVLVAAALMGA